jgi:hypothetical protein
VKTRLTLLHGRGSFCTPIYMLNIVRQFLRN